MEEIKHEWHHEMIEIYGAAIEELLGELGTDVSEAVLLKLKNRVDKLRAKYEKRKQLDAQSWLEKMNKNGW